MLAINEDLGQGKGARQSLTKLLEHGFVRANVIVLIGQIFGLQKRPGLIANVAVPCGIHLNQCHIVLPMSHFKNRRRSRKNRFKFNAQRVTEFADGDVLGNGKDGLHDLRLGKMSM